MMRARGSAATILWVLLAASASFVCDAQQAPSVEMQTLTYASRDGRDLLLDLYLPQTPIRKPAPVIVFLHGGGWSGGTRTTGPDFKRLSLIHISEPTRLLSNSYAVFCLKKKKK